MIDIDMIRDLSNAFGPSGFEEEVVKVIGRYLKGMEVDNDAMNNVYAWFRKPGPTDAEPGNGSGLPGDVCSVDGCSVDGCARDARSGRKPVIMLDAHTDECGFMVQGIMDNGLLSMVMLGGDGPVQPSGPHGPCPHKERKKGKGNHHVPPRTLHDGKRKERTSGHRRHLY